MGSLQAAELCDGWGILSEPFFLRNDLYYMKPKLFACIWLRDCRLTARIVRYQKTMVILYY